MAKDLLLSIGIGASMQAGAGAVFGSTRKYLAGLGKAIEANARSASRIEAYRTLEARLGKTRTAAREAAERVVKLGAAMRKAERPSKAMQKELGKARREAQRFTARVAEQARALDKHRAKLRAAGEDVRDLARRERELGAVIEKQRRQRDRLTASLARQQAATERRSAMRGRLVDAVALGYPLVRTLKGTIGEAVRFESVMADVRKVMDFETPGQFEAMGRDLRILSTRLPVTAEGLGAIAAAAGQAGIARHELLRFTEDAAKIGVAFDLGAREAGSAMTGLRNIFKLNQDQLMDLAGAYNHLSNNMDATAADMLRVANRSGSTAQEMFGLTGQQVGALGAAFLALKTPPEVAGTAINAMLTKLATADEQGAKFQDALDEIGMSAEDLREAIERDGQGALLAFLEAIEQADDKQSVLFNLFGQEYVDDVAKLTGGLDLYRQAIALSSSDAADAGSVLEEYRQRAATTGNALTLLRNRFARLGGAIGDAFLPALKDGTGWLGRAIDKASELAERFPAVTRTVAGLGIGLVGLKIAAIAGGYGMTFLAGPLEAVWRVGIRLGPALGQAGTALARLGPAAVSGARTALVELAGAVRSPRQAIRGLGAALATLRTAAIPAAVRALGVLRLALISTGIGAAVVAIAAGAALIVKYWEPIKAFFGGVARGIGQALEPLREAFAWLSPVGDAIGKIFKKLFGPIQTSTEDMERFGTTGEKVGRVIGAAFEVLLTPIAAVSKGVGWVLEKLNLIEDGEPPDSASVPAGRPVLGAAVAGTLAVTAPASAATAPDLSTPPAAQDATTAFTADLPPPPPAVSRGPTTITVTVGDVVIQAPAGADPADVAAEVRREMEAIMREASIEAGLAEHDGTF